MSVYPGPGTQIAGAYALTAAITEGQSVATPPGAGFQTQPFKLGFTTSGCNFIANIPKLAAGDSWTQGYLSGYLSSDGSNTHQVELVGHYWKSGVGFDGHTAGSRSGNIALTGGALVAGITWFLFPDIRFTQQQGIAKAFFLDLGQVAVDETISVLANINNFNVEGLAQGVSLNGVPGDMTFTLQNKVGGLGDAMVLYSPTLTLFSALQYAWIPPSAGGVSIAPEMLALGMFGRGRRA